MLLITNTLMKRT